MTTSTPLFRALLPAALAIAGLVPSAAQALELTELPGVVASASGCYLNANCDASQDWSPAHVIDGLDYDLTGRYSWNAGTWATASSPQWVRLDFGSTYRLDNVELRFGYNGRNYAGYTNVYEFRTSTDGAAWTIAANGTLIDSTDPTQLNNTLAWTAGSGPVARYVEYRVVGGSHWAALGELNVQGVAAPVPEPSTAAMALAGLMMAGLTARRRMKRG